MADIGSNRLTVNKATFSQEVSSRKLGQHNFSTATEKLLQPAGSITSQITTA